METTKETFDLCAFCLDESPESPVCHQCLQAEPVILDLSESGCAICGNLDLHDETGLCWSCWNERQFSDYEQPHGR